MAGGGVYQDVYKRQLLNYPKDSAGSIMTTEFVFLHPDATVEESFARIRSVGIDKETIYTCYVTQNRVLLGVVTVRRMLLSSYAVSYTHLDVYKRQRWSRGRSSAMWAPPGGPPAPTCTWSWRRTASPRTRRPPIRAWSCL